MVKMTVAEVNVNLRYLAIKYNKRLMYLAISMTEPGATYSRVQNWARTWT